MKITELLLETKERTLLYFDLPESEWNKTYAEGKWTVRQILHHLADAETVLYDRIRRVISEPQPVVWAFDQDLWAKHLDYDTIPLEINRAIYSSVRDSVIFLAKNYYETLGERPFVHSQTGLRTLKDEFDKVAYHNQHHLAQIAIAIHGNWKG